MTVVTVMYPRSEGSTFDFDYYLAKHIPLAKARFGECGMTDVRLFRGEGTLDGTAPAYALIAELFFPSVKHVQDAMARHRAEVIADIPNYTNVQPVVQLCETL
ncbi:EthD family reductase [Acidobacteria bacterium AB60]|nr:EthD family reductase [Acidobacteria bacterium AB60]